MNIGDKITERFAVVVFPEDGIWIAEIPSLDLLTHGSSPAEAVFMLSDLLKLMTDECVKPGRKHCWCRPTRLGKVRAVKCCLCKTKKRVEGCTQ